MLLVKVKVMMIKSKVSFSDQRMSVVSLSLPLCYCDHPSNKDALKANVSPSRMTSLVFVKVKVMIQPMVFSFWSDNVLTANVFPSRMTSLVFVKVKVIIQPIVFSISDQKMFLQQLFPHWGWQVWCQVGGDGDAEVTARGNVANP